jgi:hypothetical protein
MSYDCQTGFEALCDMLRPDFKTKVVVWFSRAKSRAKAEEGADRKEDYFSLARRDWDTFKELVEETGFHLISCYPGGTEQEGTIICGQVPPYVIGDYIYSAKNHTKRTLKERNPRFYHSLLSRLETIFLSLKESDAWIYEIFDEETEEMMAHGYDPNDPNLVRAEDY